MGVKKLGRSEAKNSACGLKHVALFPSYQRDSLAFGRPVLTTDRLEKSSLSTCRRVIHRCRPEGTSTLRVEILLLVVSTQCLCDNPQCLLLVPGPRC